MKLLHRFFWILIIGLSCLASTARAQTGRATLSGHVTDASGGFLRGAQVQLEPAGLSRASDAQGAFTFADLAPGNYKLTITYVGFKTFESDVTMDAGQNQDVAAQLDLNSQTEAIIVTAEALHGEGDA